MKHLLVAGILALGFTAGCQSPAASYVHAEADAWAVYDPYLDAWIDASPVISTSTKEQMHMLNKGRRARVAHAIAEVDSK